jgi:hypothetical protein
MGYCIVGKVGAQIGKKSLKSLNYLRIILVELSNKTIRPLTQYPDLDCQLPVDLLPSGSSPSPSVDYQPSMSATLSYFETGNVSWFGRQAQAIFLLDRVLDVVRFLSKNKNIHVILHEATELGSRIRTFLVVLLEESRRENTTLCSAVAFSLRYGLLSMLSDHTVTDGFLGHYSFFIGLYLMLFHCLETWTAIK